MPTTLRWFHRVLFVAQRGRKPTRLDCFAKPTKRADNVAVEDDDAQRIGAGFVPSNAFGALDHRFVGVGEGLGPGELSQHGCGVQSREHGSLDGAGDGFDAAAPMRPSESIVKSSGTKTQ